MGMNSEKDNWNSRYAALEYVYGKEPNSFFKQQLAGLPAGKILLPGEGEGRNAVFAAKAGWTVDVIDQSETGQSKALLLAQENGVAINYIVSGIDDLHLKELEYDAVGLLYLHFNYEEREGIHKKFLKALKPGGTLIFEAFAKEQIKNTSGGPKDVDLLYSLEDIIEDFIDFDITVFTKETIALDEGNGHQGNAVVIRFSGKKH
jgi:2-polyprenyl-3-methyl-5-hydroxy-6-metoxy-1,4-benzoquinol methylase